MKALKYFFAAFLLLGIISSSTTGCKVLKTDPNAVRADSINHLVALALIDSQQFVMTFDRVQVKNTFLNTLNSATNFVLVNGQEAVVQFSPAYGGGPNGVGGFTVKGKVTGYQVSQANKGIINVSFHVGANVGACDVQIQLMPESNRTVSYINSTFHSARILVYGTILPLDDGYIQGRYPL
ncbi:MAG: DUF4251 domain-containing protein [Bacteroidales bacterium]|nr:DUF4251 domain-containing protein [Bacteroidales bacterium]